METITDSAYHVPVLLAETLHYLALQPGEVALDATLGGGGHSAYIAPAISPGGTLIGIDRDVEAIAAARARLDALGLACRVELFHARFGDLEAAVSNVEPARSHGLDGALFDLGVSSRQLQPERGMSFRGDAPLDMRMDASPGSGPTAEALLASSSEEEIARILREFGEERFARPIARAIGERNRSRRPLRTTAELAELTARVIPRPAWPRDIHVATRVFQALRIAVNDEIGELKRGLEAALRSLAPRGRVVAISYHSIEDRIVKQTFARWSGKTEPIYGASPAALVAKPERAPQLAVLTRKPVMASAEEVARNPRARSAKLRAAVRLLDAARGQ